MKRLFKLHYNFHKSSCSQNAFCITKVFIIGVALLPIIFSCQTILQTNQDHSTQTGRVYLVSSSPQTESTKEILQIMDLLVAGVIKKDLSILLDLVDKNKGLYLDLKGLWTYEELKEELKSENSYFKAFFYESNAEKQRKSVREILLSSEGLTLDFYFESPETCEVKIHFAKNKKLAKDLNNPYFIRIKGKWRLYRMF